MTKKENRKFFAAHYVLNDAQSGSNKEIHSIPSQDVETVEEGVGGEEEEADFPHSTVLLS